MADDQVAVFPNQKLKNYLRHALDRFDTDPPDTDFQRGYLAAIEEMWRMFNEKVI